MDTARTPSDAEKAPAVAGQQHRNRVGGQNSTSAREEAPPASFSDVIIAFSTVVFYIVDVGTDIRLAVKYFKNGHTYWGIMTLVFVLVPALFLTTFSSAAHHFSRKKCENEGKTLWDRVHCFFSFMMLGPLAW